MNNVNVNWRDAKKEHPIKEDGIYSLPCAVLFKRPNGEIEISQDYYCYPDDDNGNYGIWDYCDDDEHVIAWCYMKDFLSTVPPEFLV